jgi:hypothetical protein
MFERVKASFDAMALLVYCRILRAGSLAVGARWHDREGAALRDAINERLAVIRLVGNHVRQLPAPHQRWGLRDLVGLSARQKKAHRAAFDVRRPMDVRRQSSAGTPQRLVPMPPLPAAAC